MEIWTGDDYRRILDAAEKRRVPVDPTLSLKPFGWAVGIVFALLTYGVLF